MWILSACVSIMLSCKPTRERVVMFASIIIIITHDHILSHNIMKLFMISFSPGLPKNLFFSSPTLLKTYVNVITGRNILSRLWQSAATMFMIDFRLWDSAQKLSRHNFVCGVQEMRCDKFPPCEICISPYAYFEPVAHLGKKCQLVEINVHIVRSRKQHWYISK